MAPDRLDPDLSMGDLTDHWTEMSLSTDLLALRRGGIEEAWSVQGILAGDTPPCTLSSLG